MSGFSNAIAQHETYQEINHVKHHMDEREIVADYLSAK